MYNKKRHTDITVAPEVYQVLKNYSWPGNVRQLENTVERAISLCSDDIITCEDLPPLFCNMITAQNSSSADTASSANPAGSLNSVNSANSVINSNPAGSLNSFGAKRSNRYSLPGTADAGHLRHTDAAADAAEHYNNIPSSPPAAAGRYANETMDTDPNRASYNIAENEAALIISALEKCSGNVTAAAKLLSMNLRTLYRKIKKHQIDVDLYRHRK